MGVERSVTRWYVQRQRILHQIETLEQALSRVEGGQDADDAATSTSREEHALELAQARAQLLALGPCPKPMMG